ncbi:MAG TPA: methyl-accepting chemotaxis protein [Gemmatimonadales bacterium]|nr:methyl-accepting chemotaxis protein [Gemmatimonadales bacterium]
MKFRRPEWTKLATLRSRLIVGLSLLLGGVLGGAVFGIIALRQVTGDTDRRMQQMQASTAISSLMQNGVLNEIAAAEAYLAAPSTETAERFRSIGLDAHAVRRQFRSLADLPAQDRVLLDSVGRIQAVLEVEYAVAHALADLGRLEDARRAAARARGPSGEITALIREITDREAARSQEAADALFRRARTWQYILVALLLGSAVVGSSLAYVTIRAVETPLQRLVSSAERLGEGDLRPIEHGEMAREFKLLAGAFSQTADRLRAIVKEVVDESEKIASSAGDLSAISEQLAASSGEISTSMFEISSGAEQQATRLTEAGAAAEQLRAAASENEAAASRVAALSEEIRGVAGRHRADVQDAIGALLDVRNVVRQSSAEVAGLARASESVDAFVSLVKRIASQTNLLALNAAIEAARAGEHGRGFAVVAEEVRKLADESAAAAEQVTETLQDLRDQVDRVSRTMEQGVAKVQGVEAVSQGAAKGLEAIVSAVEGVEEAAKRVAQSAAANRLAAEAIESAASSVSEQASKHAAAAQSVTAAAEEQSASTQEMAAAAGELLAAAERLRTVVSGFRL